MLNVYINAEKELKYLSLDCSMFTGDERGNICTLTLYETVLEENTEAKEIAKLIDEYMNGYTKVEFDYELLEKTFARDIVGLSEEEKKQELMELYDCLEEKFNGIYG